MKPGELGWCFHKDHMIIQVGRDLRRSLVQSLVWSRVSYENRPGCSGFSQSNLESLQQLRTQSLLKVCSTIVVSPQWEIFFPCIQSESLISIKAKAQLYLLDMLPKGPGRLLLGPLDAFSSPGWRSPAPSASPNYASVPAPTTLANLQWTCSRLSVFLVLRPQNCMQYLDMV